MKKYNVFFLGKKSYLVNSEEEAVKQAEKDIQDLHPSFNIVIKSIRHNDI